ncbi:MAG: glycosyltransferase family 2 protein [Caldisphaeraceae archaeon]|nr:glycosyltransferase family 2 protein [Caldisphaeraceae archaeon]
MSNQGLNANDIQTLFKVINIQYQLYLPKYAMDYIIITGTLASLLAAFELAIVITPMKVSYNRIRLRLKRYPFVSIILPSYREGVLLKRALDSIIKQSYPHEKIEVILAIEKDDETVKELLKELGFDKCKGSGCKSAINDITIKLVYGTGKGKPSALNESLRYVRGEIVGVLDADDMFSRDSVLHAVASIYQRKADAVQLPREVVMDESAKSTVRGAHIRAQQAEMLLYTRLLAPIMEGISNASWVMGSGYFVKRDVLERLGGWKEEAATEDLDLSIRMIASGYKIRVLRNAPVYTEPVRSYSQLITQKERWIRGTIQLIPKVLRHPRKSWPLLSLWLMPVSEYATILWPIFAPYVLKYAMIAFLLEMGIGSLTYYAMYKRLGKPVRPLPVVLAFYGLTAWIALAKLIFGRSHEWKGTRITGRKSEVKVA